jgi:hypothetical protein
MCFKNNKVILRSCVHLSGGCLRKSLRITFLRDVVKNCICPFGNFIKKSGARENKLQKGVPLILLEMTVVLL